MDLYVVGDTTLEEVENLVQRYFNVDRVTSSDYHTQEAIRGDKEVQTVVERLNVNQGKLNMGLRTSITYGDPHYAAALMYNGILGGYPHSKLFVNVREKKVWRIMPPLVMTDIRVSQRFNQGLRFPITKKPSRLSCSSWMK